jgi:hypothetical protein
MKRIFAACFVLALLFTVPTYGQTSCLMCNRFHQCAFGTLAGGCACTETVEGGCATCGFCVSGKCILACDAPTGPATRDQLQVPAARGQQAPATTEQLQAHPWMMDDNLPAKVTAYSQTLGQLLNQEQKLLKRSWCPNFRHGVGFAVADDKTTEYKWELIPRSDDVDEYRVKRINDGKEEKIILMKTQWIILGGDDFGDLTARGDITSVKAPQ